MGATLHLSGSRRGPPQRAMVSTPSPPASESVLRASIFRIQKFQGRSRINAASTDRLVEPRVQQSARWFGSTRDTQPGLRPRKEGSHERFT